MGDFEFDENGDPLGASMSLELGEKLIFIRANSKGGRSKGKASEEIAL